MDKFNTFRKIEEEQITNRVVNKGDDKAEVEKWFDSAKETEYPMNGSACEKDGERFMRIALCNRKVLDINDRPVYHIDLSDQ